MITLMVGLIILRFPLLIIISFINTGLDRNLIWIIFLNGTYLLTAMLMILELNKLAQLKINAFAIIIFIAAPIIRVFAYSYMRYQVGSKLWELWFPMGVSLLLGLFFAFHYKRLHRDTIKYHLKWILLSVLIGILTAIVIGLVYSQISPNIRGNMKPTITIFISTFCIQLANAAVSEEPLFRGFIWGFLEKRGWKQSWILFFQAGIFCLGHVYYLPQYPISFIGAFIAALILGLLVWKSKSIGTSMIAHGIINSLGDLIQHFTWF
jgi:membrane protease YdiL (CAAX protease family)